MAETFSDFDPEIVRRASVQIPAANQSLQADLSNRPDWRPCSSTC